MLPKKVQSKHMRKHRNKKSKKCNCELKLPFLKWGGDNPNNNADLTGKLNALLTNIKEASNATTAKIKSDFKDLKDSTQNVIDDTGNHIKTTTKGIVDNAEKNTGDFTSKTKGFLTDVYKNTKETLDKVTNKDGSFPTKPVPRSNTSTSATSSLSKSTGNNSSNKNTSNITNNTSSSSSSSSSKSNQSNSTKYTNAIQKRRSLLNNSGSTGSSGNQQGGKRRSSKRNRSRKNIKSKRTKRRRHVYKHKGGSHLHDYDGPVGIEKSSLAFTASPISNIKAVGPTPDQIYGQTPYPAWRFNN